MLNEKDSKELLNLPDEQLQQWLEQHQHSTSLTDEQSGLLTFWKDHNYSIKSLRQTIEFDMVPKKKSTQGISIVYKIAASVMLILSIALGGYFFLNTTNQPVYTQYYIAEPALPVFLATEKNKWQTSMQAYEQQDFKSALKEFDKLNITSDTLYYYKAICLFKIKQNNEAFQLLKQIPEGSRYYYSGIYLSAWQYAEAGNIKRAKANLRLIPNTHNLYSTASLFLKALENQKEK